MSRPGALRSALPAALALTLTGCGFLSNSNLPGTVIDGWRIGQPMDCPTGGRSECVDYIPAAIAGFDQRDPDHLPISSTVLYNRGDPLGNSLLQTCSGGCPVIAVFLLIDGSFRAIGVGTPGVSTEPMTFDYGPDLEQP